MKRNILTTSALFATMVEESFAGSRKNKVMVVKQRDVGIQVLQATGMPVF